MNKKITINKAIIEILKQEGKSLSAKEIYSKIVELDLYTFKSAKPYHIVLTQLRRHCVGLDFPTAHKEKYFILLPDGTYGLKEEGRGSGKSENRSESGSINIKELKDNHNRYINDFKRNLIDQLRKIEPSEFEYFSKKLLDVYGFKNVRVTKKSRDGGIDGYGKLKVGISFLNVAFQSKKWNATKVSRTEIDKFRGATQGDFEQAILFTTSSFSKEALRATHKRGAIPVILVDGNAIVELMIEKNFGIEIDVNLPVYLSALDDILF